MEDNAGLLDHHRRETEKHKRKDRAERKEAGVNEGVVIRAFAMGKKTRRQDVETAYTRALNAWIELLRELYEGYVIRRTINSLDWKGEPISGLPPYHEHALLLRMTEDELHVLSQLAEEVVEEGGGVRQLQVSCPQVGASSTPRHAGDALAASM